MNRPLPAASVHDRLRLVTWNVHGFRDAHGRYVGEQVAAALEGSDADVLALQEVDSIARPGRATLPLDRLAAAFPHRYVTYTIRHRSREYGHAVLSRRPLHAACEHDVRCGGFEMRRLIDVEIDLATGGGPRLRVVAAHLDLAPWARWAQLRRIARIAGDGAAPTIVVGDLNTLGAATVRRRVGAPLELVPSPPTFPAARPRFALDRALCRPPGLIADVSIAPLPRELSDHLPLRVEIVVPRG